jgi:hypothetical protein
MTISVVVFHIAKINNLSSYQVTKILLCLLIIFSTIGFRSNNLDPCRYPEERVPLHTSSKIRGRACNHVLPRTLWCCHVFCGSASLRGELRCCHVSHGPQQAVDHRNKERLSYHRHVARLTCF